MTEHVRICRELQAYYDEEARREVRKPLTGRRVELRSAFVDRLEREDRRSLVDFGAGPGRDVEAFAEAGLDAVGLDLAPANGVLASRRGLAVVPASVTDVPFADGSFAAGWSMSTLMHLPVDAMRRAVGEMVRVLVPGSPLWVGMWGGDQGDMTFTGGIDGMPRYYDLREMSVNRSVLDAVCDLESAQRWDIGEAGWHYQVYALRTPR